MHSSEMGDDPVAETSLGNPAASDSSGTTIVLCVAGILVAMLAVAVVVYRQRLSVMQARLDYGVDGAMMASGPRKSKAHPLSSVPVATPVESVAMALSSCSAPLGRAEQSLALAGKKIEMLEL
jgi:hypothetical protein